MSASTCTGFALGEILSGETGSRELCLVLIAGRAKVAAGGQDFGEIGERLSPLAGAPWSVYAPEGASWRVTPTTDLELAVCSAGVLRIPRV